MKARHILGYICVTVIMFFVGFALFGALGFAGGYAIGLTNQATGGAGDPMQSAWGNAAMFSALGGMMFALSVFVGNPFAVLMNKYLQWSEEYEKQQATDVTEKKVDEQ